MANWSTKYINQFKSYWRGLNKNDTNRNALKLTHLPLYKMTAILADGIFKWIFLNEKNRIFPGVQLTLSLHWFK